jgi:hypothetical protein
MAKTISMGNRWNGTYANVAAGRQGSGQVVKTIRCAMDGARAGRYAALHRKYLEHMQKVVKMPETRMESRRMEGGGVQLIVVQQDLRDFGGILVWDAVMDGIGEAGRRELITAVLDETLKVYRYSASLAKQGVALGIDSHLGNWWRASDGSLLFFDTTPPAIICENLQCEDILMPVSQLVPNRLSRALGMKPVLEVCRKLFEQHYFDWPFIFGDIAASTAAKAPKLGKEVARAMAHFAENVPGEEAKVMMQNMSHARLGLRTAEFALFRWLDR